jgi:hypothetical protein
LELNVEQLEEMVMEMVKGMMLEKEYMVVDFEKVEEMMLMVIAEMVIKGRLVENVAEEMMMTMLVQLIVKTNSKLFVMKEVVQSKNLKEMEKSAS